MHLDSFWSFSLFVAIVNTVAGDKSLCTKWERRTYTDMQGYPVTYIETYNERCRLIFTCRRTRINSYRTYKPVQRSRDVQVQVCCEGYGLSVQNFRDCEPICSKPCTNAQCSEPNTCSCEAGYASTDDPTYCEPVCSNGCSNGKCAKPDECVCDFGYEKTASETCQPICTESCVNGTCAAPDTCVCLPGFRKPEDSRDCQPYCATGCEHGACIAPEMCKCDEGYAFTDGRCLPICQGCANGHCIAPGNCQCNDGYNKDVNQTCQPQCESCTNGTCVSPGNCTCNNGFVKNTNGFCAPYCKDGCQNGVCVSPELCSCNEGYKNSTGKCVPHCDKCENGECTSPGKCKCLTGYEYATNSTDKCIPSCSPKCADGESCSGPNMCTCKLGYKKIKDTCKPQCKSCVHGTCTSPEECSCSYGYKHPANATDRCIPICKLGCENGTCAAPNRCVCAKGYREAKGTCYPYCKKCLNGNCVSPGKCECLEGYKYDGKSREVCAAVCAGGCEHGICIEPDVCVCDAGYIADEQQKCLPKCKSCGPNAACVAPEKCECHSGYKMLNGTGECVPNCDADCSNETIAALNPWSMDGTICRLGCVNGTCAEPGQCICSCGFNIKVLEDNNTYCVFSENEAVNCTTEASKLQNDASDELNESTGSMSWIYVGVTLLLICVLLLALVHQRGRLRKLTSKYRSHSYRTDVSVYSMPESVLSDE